MTIKGPNAHSYSGGLGELLGWEQSSRYDYAGNYDVEAHRRYLYERQQQNEEAKTQQQYRPEYNNNSGFANALNNSPSRQRLSVANATNDQDDEARAAEQKIWWEKKKKQALNIFGFIVIILIWLASGSFDI